MTAPVRIERDENEGDHLMSIDSLEYEQVDGWLRVRWAEIMKEWTCALCEVIDDAPLSMEMIVRLDDAANKQAREERLAYLYGSPMPNGDAALHELIKCVRDRKQSSDGTSGTLPPCGRTLFGSDIDFQASATTRNHPNASDPGPA
ncbi:hypothetical protein [Bradyrhizobium cenepequi]